jgi:glyoxylase-like metal-dependent hydrolase (beta-lactamase superfamily II)
MKPRFSARADWFSRREVAGGIWHIEEPAYNADYRCNIFLIQGEKRDLVIDSGLGLASLREFLKPISETPVLIASHAHYDHLGSNWEFENRWAHAAEAEILAHPTRENTFGERFLETADFAFLPWEGFDVSQWQPQAAPATRILENGEILDLGNRKLEVIHAPGHSPGLICLWDAQNRALFSTDAVYDGEIFDFLPCSDISTYLKTMKKLRELPVEVAYPCHNQILDGARFRAVIDAYLSSKGAL